MSNSTTRSFSAKRNKMSAAEVRRKVLEGSYIAGSIPEPFDPAALSSATRVFLPDVAEPVDVEESLSSRAIARTEIRAVSSSPQRIRDLTEKDVDIRTQPRTRPFQCAAAVHALEDESVEGHIKDLIASYERDFTIVEHRYESFGSSENYSNMASNRVQIAESLPRQYFETDIAETSESVSSGLSKIPFRSISQVGDHPDIKRSSTISVESAGSSGSKDDSQSQQLHASTHDPIVPNVTLRIPPPLANEATVKRNNLKRSNYLVNLLPVEAESDVIEKRPKLPTPADLPEQRLILRILKFALDPQIEPIFASVALYDANERRKLSENFYFDTNSDDLLSLVCGHLGVEDEASKCQQALFSVNDIRPGVFLVFKFEKILQGMDIAEAVDPYLKDERALNREKLANTIKEACERLGGYRMPLGWAAIDLHSVLLNATTLDSGNSDAMSRIDEERLESASIAEGMSCHGDAESIISVDRMSTLTTETLQHAVSTATITSTMEPMTPSHRRRNLFTSSSSSFDKAAALNPPKLEPSKLEALTQPLTVAISSFYKQDADRLSDEDLLKILAEARKSSSSKLGRLRSVPIDFKIELSLSKLSEIPAKLSSELLEITPFVREVGDPLSKDIAAFPRVKEFIVNSFYRNLIYVYPKSVNFASKSGNARNIAVKVELLDSNSAKLKAIFGKSSTQNRLSKVYSSVLYHNKAPQFLDEFKLELPPNLNDGHHILFTFVHISCKPGKLGEVETPIGWTWHPLYRNGQLQTGDFCLPISQDPLPPSICYLSPLVPVPNIRWLDGHKPLFQVSINALSTVHPQDPFLAKFFTSFEALKAGKAPPPNEAQLVDVVKGIIKAPPQPLVSFLYAILDRLLALIGSPPYSERLTTVCFETLCHLVKVCTMLLDGSVDHLGRSQLLAMYLHYHQVTTNDVLKGGPEGSPTKAVVGKPAPLADFEADHLDASRNRDSLDLLSVIKNYERKTSSKLLASVDETTIEGDRKLMHEEIAAFLRRSQGTVKETACSFSWFFLELILKSMSEYLGACNRFYLPRKLRFRDSFLADVHQLSALLTSDIIDKLAKDPRQARSANASLAFFLRDALSLVDRTFILGLVREYLVAIAQKVAAIASENHMTQLIGLRISFLRIVCSHEHFALLNLPFEVASSGGYQSPFKASNIGATVPPPASPEGSGSALDGSLSPSSLLELTPSYRSKHFLLGVVLGDLNAVLQSANTVAQGQTIALLRTLIAAHEADPRLSDSALKNRVASLYLPLIGILMDARMSLHDPYGNSTLFEPMKKKSKHGPGVNPKVALAISGLAGASSLSGRDSSSPRRNLSLLTKELTQQLLAAFLWTIRNIDNDTLKHWMRELSPHRVNQFVDLLQLCVSCFEHEPGRVAPISASSSAVIDAGAAMDCTDDGVVFTAGNRKTSDAGSVASFEDRVRWRLEDSGMTVSNKRKLTTITNLVEADTVMERTLSTEVSVTVLETTETLLRVLAMPASDHLHYLRPVLVRLLMHMLACHQSVTALEAVFTAQRAFVSEHAGLVFEERPEICAELCLQLLRHLSSRLPAVRSNAAASLYLLMRSSFEASTSFARVKMQITMSLSTLVSNAASYGFTLSESNLRRSLKTLLIYLESDASSPELIQTTFATQVKDLVFNLHMILTDTVKMKNVSNDFEMLIDLMFRIAKGYQTNPDLRLTWLINIANKHAERENYAEAGQCILHCAALVAEYLRMRSFGELPLPSGAVEFEDLSENILEESATSDDVISPDSEGICESAHFTPEGFVHLIEKAVNFFEKAQFYELLPNLYRHIMPLFEVKSDFTRQAAIHQYLSEQLKRIDPPVTAVLDISDAFPTPLPGADKRCFGTYFRVGFYGYRFGDLNGEEFVYKEPAITKLHEISHRLEAFYVERLGRTIVEVIKDSNDVDPRKLNPEKAYLQITYVEPHLETWERRRRGTHLQCNYKIRRFVFATPFTKDGKAHGDLKDQFKRRTVLTVQQSFPYLKTRLRVVGRDQVVLSPIEVAIEDIQKKTRELTAATVARPADAKMLQMVLQGCIGTTVNLGPVQIARVFLSHVTLNEKGKPYDKLQNKLRLCFKDFLKKCADALAKNSELIGPDQADYQRELQRNYADVSAQLAQITGAAPRTPFAQLQLHTADAIAVAADLGPITAV
uniref:C2 DOCK-type domain-containing protein n=1 Tax=Panagrellus redivivus TaxID=6233 RepID=A0A7E4ZYH3_PANRE